MAMGARKDGGGIELYLYVALLALRASATQQLDSPDAGSGGKATCSGSSRSRALTCLCSPERIIIRLSVRAQGWECQRSTPRPCPCLPSMGSTSCPWSRLGLK